MRMLRVLKGRFDAARFDFYLLRNYGRSSVKKNWVNRKYHKCPKFSVIQKIHIVPERTLEAQRRTNFKKNPKISIVTPLYNTPRGFLEELLESVRVQTYGNWELCLADGSDEAHRYVGRICEEKAKIDKRIVYHRLHENKGISGNTNRCIELSTGEFIGLLDHDDLLHPSALFEVVKVINEQGAEFIYSDEVKFKDNIQNIDNPIYFNLKPGFSKYDLRAHNYICHFTVFARSLLKSQQEFYREAFDGSQDHDMVLRLTEKTNRIVHIPKVLYYWRLHSNSVSMDLDSKSYAIESAFNAVREHLERSNEDGSVSNTERLRTLYRIRYKIEGNPKISLVLHGSDDKTEVRECIEKIVEHTDYRPIEIVYSCKEDISEYYSYNNVTFMNIRSASEQTKACVWNQGVGISTGEHIVLLDTAIRPLKGSWLNEMLMYSQKKDVCVVGPKILYKDGTIAYAGLSLWKESTDKLRFLCQYDTKRDDGYEAMLLHARKTTAALASCMMFSKNAWEKLQRFSDKCLGYEDIDFCIRGLSHYKYNIWTCFSEMEYAKPMLMGEVTQKQTEKFEEEHRQLIDWDEGFHPGWDSLGLV